MNDVQVKLDRSVLSAILKGGAGDIDTRGLIRAATDRVVAAAGEGHGSELAVGRQRLNGRIWTITHQAAVRQHRDGTLMKATRAGAV